MATYDRIDRLKKSLEKAKSMKLPHQSEMRDCYLLTIPSREVFTHQPGTQIDRHRLYDSTATSAVLNLTTLIMRLMVPPTDRWAGVEIREGVKKHNFPQGKVPFELQTGLNNFNRELYEIIGQSNFYLATDEAMHDVAIAGTSCLAIYGSDGHCPIEYRAIHPEQLFFTENHCGKPDIVFREHKMSTRQISQRWEISKLPKEVVDQITSNPEQKHTIVEVEEPIDDRQFIYSCHLKDQDWHELEHIESKFRTFLVFRWQKAANEWWGESPVRHALPTIRSCNRMAELIEVHGEYESFGLWQNLDTASDMSKLSGKLTPGSIINLEVKLEPIEFGGNFSIGKEMLTDLRTQIKELLFDSPLPSTAQNNYLSATEVNARLSEFYRRIGQPALRLEEEFLEPVVHWTVERLVHFGHLPKPDPMIVDMLGGKPDTPLSDIFAVVVTSATKKVLAANEAQTDLQALAQAGQIIGPQLVLKHVDMDKFARAVLLDLGLGADMLRSDEQVKALEQQQQALQQGQQVLGVGNQVADIIEKTKGLTTPNAQNPVQTLTRGIQQPPSSVQ